MFPAFPATVNISGPLVTDDTTLYSNVPFDNAGGSDRMRAGETQAHGTRRALIRFNLSSIPRNATITSVSLNLLMTEAPGVGPPDTTQSLYRITHPWVEGTGFGTGAGGTLTTVSATWNNCASTSWTKAGGDYFAAERSATADIGNLTFTNVIWAGKGMVSDVQSWVTWPRQNYGWILKGEEIIIQTARGYGTSDSLEPSEHPVLTVTYSTPSLMSDQQDPEKLTLRAAVKEWLEYE
ncbi:MAG: DNRLRE domain-containing protein [Candidatus Sumerlaeaceae bacterium]|nr:DNRLRE domain-containing protein [Candidatus Sumerlaeaceae bacterium]